LRTPPFLLEHYPIRTKVVRTATASERPSVGPGRARDDKPARIPLWPPGQHEVPTNGQPRCRPARPEARPNQRLYVPLGSPPSVAVGSSSARAAHRSCAPLPPILASRVKIARGGASQAGYPESFRRTSATSYLSSITAHCRFRATRFTFACRQKQTEIDAAAFLSCFWPSCEFQQSQDLRKTGTFHATHRPGVERHRPTSLKANPPKGGDAKLPV